MPPFVPANQRENKDNRRLSELPEEEIIEIAKKYTRQDWHIVRDTLEELGLEVDENKTLQALFNTKYKALKAKQESKAGEDALANISIPKA